MTEAQTVSSEVDVAVDPATAFTAFTEEMDLWWVRGPINFWSDGGRVVEVRCEPGVGGRIIEVLDDPAAGTVFERARITLWEPGTRLGWASSTDDVQTEVSFARIAGGTRVTVTHVIPAGGHDRGGSAWSRVVPKWFGPWCARRDRVRHEQIDVARLSLGVYYARPAAAARWLADVFGFEPAGDLPGGRTRSPRASTATRGSSSGSAMPCSTSSSSTENEPAARVRMCRGSTSTTSLHTSSTPRAGARPSWTRSTPIPALRSMSPTTWKGIAGPSRRRAARCADRSETIFEFHRT